MFAIIVGGAILFFSIYGAMNWGSFIGYQGNTETAKSISVLTDPLQAGFTEGSFGKISFRSETNIQNHCFNEGLGWNEISVSTNFGIGEGQHRPGIATEVHNKYIFSEEENIGKEFYVLSKPFDFPYKVADMIFLTSKNFCFFDAPEDVVEDLSFLKMTNVKLDENCTFSDFVKVCFESGEDCDVKVYGDLESGSVPFDVAPPNWIRSTFRLELHPRASI